MDISQPYTTHKFILCFKYFLRGGLLWLTEMTGYHTLVQQFSLTNSDTRVAWGLLVWETGSKKNQQGLRKT